MSKCDGVCPLWGVDLSSPRSFCVFIVVYNYARLPSRHVCWVACPLRLCLDGLVVVSGVCDPEYVGLCVPERLRLIDFVVSCWTMFGPDRVGLWGSVGLCLLCFPSMGLDRVWPCPLRVVCLCAGVLWKCVCKSLGGGGEGERARDGCAS